MAAAPPSWLKKTTQAMLKRARQVHPLRKIPWRGNETRHDGRLEIFFIELGHSKSPLIINLNKATVLRSDYLLTGIEAFVLLMRKRPVSISIKWRKQA